MQARLKCGLIVGLLLIQVCSQYCPFVSGQEEKTTGGQAAPRGAETHPQDEELTARRLLANSEKALSLSAEFTRLIQTLLKAAGDYDLESYRKADDEINDVLEKQDANYLESLLLLQLQNLPQDKKIDLEAKFARIPQLLVESKMNCYKSSAIFYLCFGLPLQSSHYARLALNLLDAKTALAEQRVDLLFYSGVAELWSGNYKESEKQLERLLSINPEHKFARAYMGETLIAEQQIDRAIAYLENALLSAKSPEARGQLERELAFAFCLSNNKALSSPHILNSKQELQDLSKFEYPALALESRGIVNALSGDFKTAAVELGQALNSLQDSPLNKGNKLEAAQCALWRSYCMEKLGEKSKAIEDRTYALSFNTEASHIQTLAGACDTIFKHEEKTQLPSSVADRWALSVGISSFEDPSIPKLRYPAKDARDLAEFLTGPAGFKQDHVKTLLDSEACLAEITGMLGSNWLAKLVKPGDLVLIFISSHGTPSYKNIGVMNSVVTYDTHLDSLFSASIPMQSLVRLIRRNFKNQYVIAVLDTCYAGALAAPGEEAKHPSNLDPQLCLVSRRQLLAASSDCTERSWESKRYPNSIFTRQLIQELQQSPNYADFHPLFERIAEKVNREVTSDFRTTQTPRLAGQWHGRGILRVVGGEKDGVVGAQSK